MLGIAVFGGMQIEHELPEGPLQPGQRAPEDDETGTCQLCRRLEIHQAKALADVEMLLGHEIELFRFAPAAALDIVVLVGAVRHIGMQQIRQALEHFGQRGDGGAFALLRLGHRILDVGDLGHQLPDHGVVARSLGPADLFGDGVAPLLHVVEIGNRRAPRVVEGKRLFGLGSEAAPHHCRVENLGVGTNPFDVEHARPVEV